MERAAAACAAAKAWSTVLDPASTDAAVCPAWVPVAWNSGMPANRPPYTDAGSWSAPKGWSR